VRVVGVEGELGVLEAHQGEDCVEDLLAYEPQRHLLVVSALECDAHGLRASGRLCGNDAPQLLLVKPRVRQGPRGEGEAPGSRPRRRRRRPR